MKFARRVLHFVKIYPREVMHDVTELLSDLCDDLTTNCADLKSGAVAIFTAKPNKNQLHDFAITAVSFTALPIILLLIPILSIMAAFSSTFEIIHDV